MNNYPFQDYAGDNSFDYPFDIVLTPNQNAPNEGKRTDTDSDFLLFGLTLNNFSSILFTIQFKDANGNYFSSAPIFASNYNGQGSAPYMFPGTPRIFPPGSQIGIGLLELSGFTNTIEMTFRGIKRFVKPQPICGQDALTNRLLVRA
jgi:hypothetical protein